MVQFLSFVFVIVIICFYIKFKNDEKEAERARKNKRDEENRLRKNYPQGYNYYKRYYDQNKYTFHGYGVSERNTDEIVALKSEIIKYQEKINNDIRKAAKEDEDFIVRQDKLNTDSLTIAKKCLRDFGWYFYSIPWKQRTADGSRQDKSLTVWQFFVDNLCLDQDLDYSLMPASKQNFENIGYFKDKTRHWNDFVYDKINSFLTEISKKYHLGILFNQYIANWEKDSLNYHYSKILKNIPNTRVLNEESTRDVIPNDIEYLVIIDCYTENPILIDNCKYIFKQVHHPCIIYLSLLKCHDRKEMQELIDQQKKVQEEKEREKQKIAEAHKNMVEATQKWDTIFMGFQAISMLDYYPTTSNANQTSDIWNNRHMVWNFKNNPEKVYDEENAKAVEWAVKQAEEIIVTTFGKENAQYITFVCIPASSQEMTERRYKVFSEKLCKVTGMINAFNHIKVTQAKAEKHNGGTSFSQDMIEFDKDFFKNKYVLLFDDVITSGSSMKSFKSKLHELGSTVIGGMSLGRTKDKYNEHTQRVTLESLGIKSIPKPLFTKGGKSHPHNNDTISNTYGIISTQDNTPKGHRVGYDKAPIYNDMPLNTYPAIRFPENGCIVFPYRTGKQFRRGYTEQLFEDFIKLHLPNSFSIIGNAKILLGDECRPYEPDIAIIASSNKNIRIDIEIDEPYNGVTREPAHFIGCGDEFRDLNIVNAGWIVMRFTEEQIFCEKEKCLNEIYRLLWSLDSNYVFEILNFDRNIHLGIKPFWTELDAKMMAVTNFRENYLHHNFGKEKVALSKQEYLKQTEEEKEIAKQIKCIPQLRVQNQNNIDNTKLSFVQDKDIEFFAKEHIYVYKKFIQLKAVSEVISMFFRKFDSIGWSHKKALVNGVSQRYQLEQWDCKGAESREVGTYLHEQIHKYFIKKNPDFIYHFIYNGEVIKEDKRVDISKEYGYFKKFLNEEKIIPFRTEWQIFDPVLRIAGTIDFLSRNDREFDLYDWKRSDKIDRNATVWDYGINGLESVPDTRYYHYCLQLNMYKYILEKNYNIAINKMYLVVLHPVYNTYQKIEVPTMTNVVNSIIRYYQTIA